MLLSRADPKILTTSIDATSGNVDGLVSAVRDAGLTVAAMIDGDRTECTRENKVLCAIYSLEKALKALPPDQVIDATIARITSVKRAPRVDKDAIATLKDVILSSARRFAERDPESAVETSAEL